MKNDRSPKGLLLLQFFDSDVTFEEYKDNFFRREMFDERYELCVTFVALEYFFVHQFFFYIYVLVGYLHSWKKIRFPGV